MIYNKLLKLKQFLKISTYLTASILLGSWIADGIKGDPLLVWLPDCFQIGWVRIVIIVLFIILMFYLLYKIYEFRKNLPMIRVPIQTDMVEPHKAIIAPLTYYDQNIFDLIFNEEDCAIKLTYKGSDISPTILLHSVTDKEKAFDDFTEQIQNKWSWQQILRGVKPHRNKLTHIIFIPTKVTDHLFPKVVQLIHTFLPNVDIRKGQFSEKGDFELLMYDFERAIIEIKKEKIRESEIVIDVTGGQKTQSIAGAVVTLKKNVTFQYVDTNDKDSIKMFDVIIEGQLDIS